MAHNVATIFNVEKRGFIREGYYADLVLIDLNKPTEVTKQSLLYKCGWSPFEGIVFSSSIAKTFVNGNLVYDNGTFNEAQKGMRMTFERR